MGNKMCASWQKGMHPGTGAMYQPWPARKHLHLIRLWAEIFEVREEGGRLVWGRVWDEVVPVNVICIQDSPVTVYQITAYDQLVKKIFDVQLCQPGTLIVQTSECFVHWNDPLSGREWGLNFTRPADARQFFECCTMRVVNGLSRKASSSESLRPKSQKRAGGGAKMASNQSSPTAHHQHCAMSTSIDSDSRHCATTSSQQSAASQQLQALSASVDQWCHSNAEQLSAPQDDSSRHSRQHQQPPPSQRQCSHQSSCSDDRRSCCNIPTADVTSELAAASTSGTVESSTLDASEADETSSKADPSTLIHEGERIVDQNSEISDKHDASCGVTFGIADEETCVHLESKALHDSPSRDQHTNKSSSNSPCPCVYQPCSPPHSVMASVPSSPRADTVALNVDDTMVAADSVSNSSVAMEGYTSESSAVAACCGDDDIYDVIGGGRSAETRFVESQEKICKFFDDFEERLSSGTLQAPDVTSHHHRHHHHHNQQSLDDAMALEASGGGEGSSVVEVAGSVCPELVWDGLHGNDLYNGFYCPDVDIVSHSTSSQLLDMVDWPPPPPRWQNDGVDEDDDDDDEPSSSRVEVVVAEKTAETEFDSLALQRLIDSIPTPFRTPSVPPTVVSGDEPSTPTPTTTMSSSIPPRRDVTEPLCTAADDGEVDSVLDGGSGSPDDSTTNGELLPQHVSGSAATERSTTEVKGTASIRELNAAANVAPQCVDDAAARHVTKTSGVDDCRSRQALTVSVISADSGCSSQSDAAADVVPRSTMKPSTTEDTPTTTTTTTTTTLSTSSTSSTSQQMNHQNASDVVNPWSDVIIRSNRPTSAHDDQRLLYYADRGCSPSSGRQRYPPAPTFSSFTGRPPAAPPAVSISQPASAPVLRNSTGAQSTEIPDLLRTRSSTLATSTRSSPQRVQSTPANASCRHQIPDGAIYAPLPPLANSHRIGKVVLELLDTERQYVRDLVSLIYRYLEPLRSKAFVSRDAVEQLLGNISKIVHFHAVFLHSLENVFERTAMEFGSANDILKDEVLRRILTLIASLFVCNVHNFKLYSMFCACHSKAQKIILSDGNASLQDFLRSCNPRQQHSVTLESYLIKPIQRILKYPLLLGQLVELTEPRTEEHQYLTEALRGMQAVAEHMNEMQKIYDEFGNTFDEMSRDTRLIGGKHRLAVNLNVCELQMYGTVRWLNASDALGKLKKSSEVLTVVFIFKSAIAIIAQEQIKAKKKSKLLSGGQSAKAAAAAVAAGAAGNDRTAGSGSGTTGNRFQIAMPIDQIQVRTVVGEQCQKHAIWEIAYCRMDNDGRPRKMVYQFLSSYKARNDFIRAIHHMIHDSVCHPGYQTTTSLAGLQVVTPIIQQQQQQHHHHHQQQQHPQQQQQQPRCSPSGVRYAQQMPPPGGSIYGESQHYSVSPNVARCGHSSSEVAAPSVSRRRSFGSSSGGGAELGNARDASMSHYGTVPHHHHGNASMAAYQLYGPSLPPSHALPAAAASQQRPARSRGTSESSSKKPGRSERS